MPTCYDLNHIVNTKRMDWHTLIESQGFLEFIPGDLRKVTERRNIAAGEMLFRAGSSVCYLYCLLSGEVRLVRHDASGGRIVLQRSRGGFIAEASIDSKTYHCDAVAAENTRLLCFPLSEFLHALEGNAHFRTMWMALLAREVRKLRTRCERLSLHNAGERIVHYLESEGADGVLTLSQSRKAWAEELGLSHEALYRTLKKLAGQGRLKIEGKTISLLRSSDYQY